MSQSSSAAADHAQALADLEAGRPLQALRAWRQLLMADQTAVEAHLQAAEANLLADAVSPLRREAIVLAKALLAHKPGESEVHRLGNLLRRWGEIALPEVPSRALQLLERAWSCGSDLQLNQQLASLHARLGYGEGAHWLAPPPQQLEAWPQLPCPAQTCVPCQIKTPPKDSLLTLHVYEHGRIGLQRQRNPWRHSHGVAVWDQHGTLQSPLSRHYPWPWPHCPHAEVFRHTSAAQLEAAARELPPPIQVDGPVLAVAELSGEMFFHWQLELLPRLGRVLAFALERWPSLRIWHNGGSAPYVHNGLRRLGIAPERLLPACDHLQAEQLLVPSFASAFGRPSAANLAWLEQLWDPVPADNQTRAPLWLARPGAVRRSVLGEAPQIQRLQAQALTQGSIPEQLAEMAEARRVIAPHGAAMANLIAAAPGAELLELVNPAYQTSYFDDLIQRRQLRHRRLEAAPTPLPLQEWLYEGPLSFPIDLRPGASAAAEALASWAP